MNTILVVDDFSSVRLFHATLLRKSGFAAEVAASGEEAWTALKAKRFDGLVLDLLMPGMSGFELLRRIRNDSRLRNLPVVVITSEAQTAVENDAITAALTKPVLPKDLLGAVRHLLESKGGHP